MELKQFTLKAENGDKYPIRYSLLGDGQYHIEIVYQGHTEFEYVDIYGLVYNKDIRKCDDPSRMEYEFYNAVIANERTEIMRSAANANRGASAINTGKSNFTLSLDNRLKSIMIERNIKISPFINDLLTDKLLLTEQND